ncbi:MAG: GNAT family N-acetyltransferase [Thermoplasmatota archaeon]
MERRRGERGGGRTSRTPEEGRRAAPAPVERPRERTIKRVRVRPALTRDRARVLGLLRGLGLEAAFDQKEFWVAEHMGRLVGCARLKFLGDCYELASLAVRPSYQGRGVGALLVTTCLDQADSDVYCLTMDPEYFGRMGFREATASELPAELYKKLRSFCGEGAKALLHPGSQTRRALRLLREGTLKDLDTTRRALEKVRIAVPRRSHYRKAAEDFLSMARSYFSDAGHFYERGDLVRAFACVNYAHGWLDAGARLGLFDVDEDDRLFTLAE